MIEANCRQFFGDILVSPLIDSANRTAQSPGTARVERAASSIESDSTGHGITGRAAAMRSRTRSFAQTTLWDYSGSAQGEGE
jgi:hypothetical protein